ncbi:hypothetical protein Tco_0653354 [Tanacetum coccineum]|uniref:Uncharacterized protein n=1 Tax=Tanacetum coccineum TaxID=301880 RepID=A0ABQ4X0Y3_9ASTR
MGEISGAIIQNLGKQTDRFLVDIVGILWQSGTMLCLYQKDPALREGFDDEAHSSPFSNSSGFGTKSSMISQQHFWWSGLPRTQRKTDELSGLSWIVWTKDSAFPSIRKDFPISRLAEMFQQKSLTTRLLNQQIVSDSVPVSRLVSGKVLQNALGEPGSSSVRLFHPDDRWTVQNVRFRQFGHASIKCAPFEMLYGRKCRAPICWDQVGERVLEGPEMIEVTNEKVAVAREKLKEAQTRQKRC